MGAELGVLYDAHYLAHLKSVNIYTNCTNLATFFSFNIRTLRLVDIRL